MQVKKFEKLNLGKFDAFKQNELTFLSAMAVEGGTLTGTAGTLKPDTDYINDSTGGVSGGTSRNYVRNDGYPG